MEYSSIAKGESVYGKRYFCPTEYRDSGPTRYLAQSAELDTEKGEATILDVTHDVCWAAVVPIPRSSWTTMPESCDNCSQQRGQTRTHGMRAAAARSRY